MSRTTARRERQHPMPFGTRLLADGRVRFRLWAPGARRVDLCLGEGDAGQVTPMQALDDGWYEHATDAAGPGSRYRFRIDGDVRVPDPASRRQPGDVHGPSEVVDPLAWQWTDTDWRGRPWEEAVFYELHVGSFSPEGTFAGVERRLDHLVDLGVTAVELMPVADFPGTRNWGYDGVYPFAPDSRYGRPEDLKALVQAAHARGLMVFMDVVYNHFGPEGNYLHLYAPHFFTERHHTPWGAAINFDGTGSRWVRRFFIDNALYWLTEYHLDGLRLDAVHAIVDDAAPDILEELADTVQATLRGRHVHLVLENDHNAARYLERPADDRPLRYAAQWNDDIHHALHTLLTGEHQGYYRDYADDPTGHLGRCLAAGFAYQGEPSAYRDGERRGEPSGHLPAAAFVGFLQNHDQVGNRAFGERLTELAPREALAAASALLLLAPAPPLLFMGEEWGSRQPFPFFCDFGADLAEQVTEGRRREFARFPEFADPAAREKIPDPMAERTFETARLDWGELSSANGRAWLAWHRDLLDLRHRRLTPRLHGARSVPGMPARLGPHALQVAWVLGDGCLLTLLANLGPDAGPNVEAPQGECLHATPAFDPPRAGAPARLPPWSTAWFLALPEAPA